MLSLPSVSDADLAPKSSAKSALCLPSSRKRAASPAVSAPSSKRSCRSVKVDSPHSLSDSSKVGLTVDAPVPGRACRSGPSASVSTPTVKQANAPEGQTLWWTCHFPGCSYQVWRLPGTHHHTARRWSHLRNTHKMPVKEIPAVPRGDVVSEAQKLRKKRTWTHMLQLIQRKGWVGNHVHPGTLNANGSALPFKCTKCHEVIKHFYNKVCSKANPPPRIHTTRAQRFVVWKTCWDKAVSLAKAEASKARPELRKQAVISKAHMEQQARTHKNVPGLQSSSVIQGFHFVEANPGPVGGNARGALLRFCKRHLPPLGLVSDLPICGVFMGFMPKNSPREIQSVPPTVLNCASSSMTNGGLFNINISFCELGKGLMSLKRNHVLLVPTIPRLAKRLTISITVVKIASCLCLGSACPFECALLSQVNPLP